MTLFGVDLSHHQDPASVPWARMNGVVDFVICRSSYGAQLRDRHAIAHIARARVINAKVGIYHFFRPMHGVASQWDMIRRVADDCGIGDGDIVPAIDIERDPIPDPGHDVAPYWSDPAHELAQRVIDEYGDCIIYITQREWAMLGKPEWVLQRPLWVAHYTAAPKPATPGNVAPFIWQYRVGPFDPQGPGGYDKKDPRYDHNRGFAALPLIRRIPHQDDDIEQKLEQHMIEHDDVTLINDDYIKQQVAQSIDELRREYFEPDADRKA